MPDVDLTISFRMIAVFAAGLAAFAASLFAYRTTIPPVSRRLRFLLSLLRGAALWLLILLLGEPVLSLLFRSEDPPSTLVLVDDSQSMTLKDQRGDELRSVLSSEAFQRLASVGKITMVLFAGEPRPLAAPDPDSITLAGEHTDITRALQTARMMAASENVQSIVLLSDGNVTTGGSPLLEADRFPIPIFTVGIGDSTEQRDLLVRKAVTNDIVYAGARVPVRVHIGNSGYDDGRIEAVLRQGATVLDRQFLSLQKGTREHFITLTFVPQEEGRQRLTVEISGRPDEVTDRNNRAVVFTKVLKSRMNVLLMAGAPGPDVAFVRRSLQNDENINLVTLIERSPGRFYDGSLTGELLRQQDCLVLVGFPGAATSMTTITMVREAAAETGTLFIPSRTLDLTKLRSLNTILPVTSNYVAQDEFQAFFHVPENKASHSLLKMSESGGPSQWSGLPPLFMIRGLFRAKPESEVLAVSRIQTLVTQDPLLVLRNVNRRKSLAFLGYGLWRWQMLHDGSHVEELLQNSIRWLALREETRRVRVTPTKDLFTTLEPVEFTALVYDESLQPFSEARVSVVVTGENERVEAVLDPEGNGQYIGGTRSLPPGEYRFVATASLNETRLGEDRGTFSIGGLNAEFLETRTNTTLLRQLAMRTGGAYYDPATIDDLPGAVESLPNFRPKERTRSEVIELWNVRWSLALLIGLFSLEWFLRKRNGML